jgi:dihydroxyacetone kinase-like protein
MLDALEPAVEALADAAARGSSLEEAFSAAAVEASKGAEQTRNMVAKHGRAKNLGDRAIGFVDPGAVSTALIFEVMAKYFQEQNG